MFRSTSSGEVVEVVPGNVERAGRIGGCVMSGNYPASVTDNTQHFALPSVESDVRGEAHEDTRCPNVAAKFMREPYTPGRFAILLCDECADGARAMGYHFDEAATIQLSRDVEREQELEA